MGFYACLYKAWWRPVRAETCSLSKKAFSSSNLQAFFDSDYDLLIFTKHNGMSRIRSIVIDVMWGWMEPISLIYPGAGGDSRVFIGNRTACTVSNDNPCLISLSCTSSFRFLLSETCPCISLVTPVSLYLSFVCPCISFLTSVSLSLPVIFSCILSVTLVSVSLPVIYPCISLVTRLLSLPDICPCLFFVTPVSLSLPVVYLSISLVTAISLSNPFICPCIFIITLVFVSLLSFIPVSLFLLRLPFSPCHLSLYLFRYNWLPFSPSHLSTYPSPYTFLRFSVPFIPHQELRNPVDLVLLVTLLR